MSKLNIGGREFASREAFGGEGRRCGTPALNDFQKSRIRVHQQALRSSGLEAMPGPIDIPVRFHVIHDGADGDVSDATIDAQVDVLNEAYAPHGISFTKVATTRTSDPILFQMTMGSAAERRAKTRLGRNTDRELNFYTAGLGGSLLGWATFPSDLAGDPDRDGVVVLHTSLPGGNPPYDLGKTAVHEVGHWLGLYHTFEGGCVPPGDEVDDTPFEARPNFGRAIPRDTCPQDGMDPVSNYMDYTDDIDMTEFTPGQIRRIRDQITLYRPLLLGPATDGLEAMAGVAFAVDMETGAF